MPDTTPTTDSAPTAPDTDATPDTGTDAAAGSNDVTQIIVRIELPDDEVEAVDEKPAADPASPAEAPVEESGQPTAPEPTTGKSAVEEPGTGPTAPEQTAGKSAVRKPTSDAPAGGEPAVGSATDVPVSGPVGGRPATNDSVGTPPEPTPPTPLEPTPPEPTPLEPTPLEPTPPTPPTPLEPTPPTPPPPPGTPPPVQPVPAPPAAPAPPEPPSTAPAPPAVPASKRPRVVLVAVLGSVLVLALVAGGLAVFRPGPVGRLLATTPTPSTRSASPAPPEPSPVLQPVGGAPAPTQDGVARTLKPILKTSGLGDRLAVSVTDVATNSPLYGVAPDTPVLPASVTKLVTATAVLRARGPAYRLTTRVVTGAKPGEVVLVGGGDPTLAVNGHGAYPGAARLDKLADQVKKSLNGRKPTKILVDMSLFTGPTTGPAWDADIVPGGDASPITSLMINAGRADPSGATSVRSTRPALDAGRQFAALLGVSGRNVARGVAGRHAKQLGAVQSPPLLHLIELMLQRSDNVIAETMARQVALARGLPASFAGGAKATTAEVAALGLDTSHLRLFDGSGLSRKDRISPAFLTSLLTLVASGGHPNLWPILTGMPVAGWSGTLSQRYTTGADAAAAGHIRAKTGSLSGTDTLAGLAMDSDGRLLAFAMMAEGTGGSGMPMVAMDNAAAALVGCGCR